jgi:hypothetical protein
VAIRNIGRLTIGEMREQIKQGARFVVYEYVISLLVVSRRRTSAVYYIRPGQSRSHYHWPYSLLTLLLGWWGVPWGPGFTIGAVRDNVRGGRDVTAQMIDTILDAAKKSKPRRSRQNGRR